MEIDQTQPFYARKNRGEFKGSLLYPHKYPDGMFVATTSKYTVDNVRVAEEDELVALVRSGYGCRMSSPDIRQQPSYISNGSIIFSQNEDARSVVRNMLGKFDASGELDLPTIAKARREQGLLRGYLLNGDCEGRCALCGRLLPSELLVAAHIKPRSSCAHDERLDFDNVAALMCALGCDRLFEKGYLVVRDGVVRANPRRKTSPDMEGAVQAVVGRSVPNWVASAHYYRWHADQFDKAG